MRYLPRALCHGLISNGSELSGSVRTLAVTVRSVLGPPGNRSTPYAHGESIRKYTAGSKRECPTLRVICPEIVAGWGQSESSSCRVYGLRYAASFEASVSAILAHSW